MKNHYKFWIILSMVIIFGAGIVGGILLENIILEQKLPSFPQKEKPPRFPSLETLAKELKLSEEQKEKIKDIFKRNEKKLKELKTQIHHEFSSIRSQLKDEIKEVLTEEQWVKLESMIEKFRDGLKKRPSPKKDKHNQNWLKKGEQK